MSGTVTGTGKVGGFFGEVNSAVTITGNESSCTVTATKTYVGGFAGRLAGSVSCSNCKHLNGKVSSIYDGANANDGSFVGGFAGYIGSTSEAFTGIISGCFVSKAIVEGVKRKANQTAESSGSWVGGFAGGIGSSTDANNIGKVEKCGVYASTKAGRYYVGGFAGVSYSTIEKCRVNGNPEITGFGNSIGGFIGYQQGNSVKYCYSNAKIVHNNKSNVGGLIGNTKNTTIEECYSSGEVERTGTTIGGVIGVENNVIKNKLIRWNHSSNSSIVGGETSVPSGCYVKQSSDNNFKTIATSLGWSTDGSIWNYPTDGTIPTLVGV